MQLASNFEDDLRESLLDDIERRAREEIGPQLRREAEQLLESYGERHEYDVRSLARALDVKVERNAGGVTITLIVPDPGLLFERGTVDHVVEAQGDGVLSFVWSERHDPPEWVKEEYEREGDGWRVFLPKVEVSGLPEARFIRDALHEIRRELDS